MLEHDVSGAVEVELLVYDAYPDDELEVAPVEAEDDEDEEAAALDEAAAEPPLDAAALEEAAAEPPPFPPFPPDAAAALEAAAAEPPLPDVAAADEAAAELEATTDNARVNINVSDTILFMFECFIMFILFISSLNEK